MLFHKLFDQITIDNIKNLISQGATESQNLEFKRQPWGRSDAEVREMLRDVSSMANKYGGYLIIGLEEDPASGQALRTVNVPNADQERDRILASCQANLSPAIPGLNIKCLNDGTDTVIIMFIPNSLRSPHLINFKGLNQFWIRHDRQKFPMSIQEIKDAFLKNYNLTENIKEFIEQRRQELIEEATGKGQPLYVLGAVPMNISEEFIDIRDQTLRDMLNSAPGDRWGGFNFNFERRVQPRPTINGLEIGIWEYKLVELYRNGYLQGTLHIDRFDLEKLHLDDIGDVVVINSYVLIEGLNSFTQRLRQLCDYFGYDGQYTLFVKLLNIQNYGLKQYITGKSLRDDLQVWTKQHLEIPPITFDVVEPVEMTKTVGDRIWQAFGYEQEPHGKDGKYVFK